jgi:hypothetical protein
VPDFLLLHWETGFVVSIFFNPIAFPEGNTVFSPTICYFYRTQIDEFGFRDQQIFT